MFVQGEICVRIREDVFRNDRNLENCKSVTYCNLCRWMDDMTCYDMIMTCDDIRWYVTIWYDMLWYDMVWYHMKCRGMCFFLFSLIPIFPRCGHGSLQIWNFQMTASHKSGCTRRMAGEWWDQRTSLQLVLFCRILLCYIYIYICTTNYITCFPLAPSTTKQGSGNGFPVPACHDTWDDRRNLPVGRWKRKLWFRSGDVFYDFHGLF